MKRYYILGENASIFFDPVSKLKVISKDKDAPDEFDGKVTARIEVAIKHGHIIEVKSAGSKVASASTGPKVIEPKVKKAVKTLSDDEKKETEDSGGDGTDADSDGELSLEEMSKSQLIQFYQDTYDVTDGEVEAFKVMKQKAMITYLRDLEKE